MASFKLSRSECLASRAMTIPIGKSFKLIPSRRRSVVLQVTTIPISGYFFLRTEASFIALMWQYSILSTVTSGKC